MEWILFSIALLALVIASLTDIKTREVPDWISYAMIAAGFGIRSIYSIMEWTPRPFVEGIIGFGIFLGIAYLMYYTGQWGGGDSKLLMGMGALFGIRYSLDSFMIGFLLNTLILGAIYGMIWSIVLAIKDWEKFSKKFIEIWKGDELKYSKYGILFACVLGIIFAIVLQKNIYNYAIIVLLLMMFFLFLTIVFTKAVERSCMQRYVHPKELTEGDWIVHDVYVGKKRICGPKDLGVSLKQIAELNRLYRQKKIKKVLMKVGIPFVPSFLFGFLTAWFYGNLLSPVILNLM